MYCDMILNTHKRNVICVSAWQNYVMVTLLSLNELKHILVYL